MQEIRCGQCQRKLAEAEFVRLSIKCPRCGTLNDVRAMSPQPERLGASFSERNHDQAPKRSGAR
ncbi:MAG: Com family DNA-binding transcriptional regulator [Rhodoferax sp.]